MALLVCLDCQKPVSEEALACVHCGKPFTETKPARASTFSCLLILLYAAGSGLLLCAGVLRAYVVWAEIRILPTSEDLLLFVAWIISILVAAVFLVVPRKEQTIARKLATRAATPDEADRFRGEIAA